MHSATSAAVPRGPQHRPLRRLSPGMPTPAARPLSNRQSERATQLAATADWRDQVVISDAPGASPADAALSAAGSAARRHRRQSRNALGKSSSSATRCSRWPELRVASGRQDPVQSVTWRSQPSRHLLPIGHSRIMRRTSSAPGRRPSRTSGLDRRSRSVRCSRCRAIHGSSSDWNSRRIQEWIDPVQSRRRRRQTVSP